MKAGPPILQTLSLALANKRPVDVPQSIRKYAAIALVMVFIVVLGLIANSYSGGSPRSIHHSDGMKTPVSVWEELRGLEKSRQAHVPARFMRSTFSVFGRKTVQVPSHIAASLERTLEAPAGAMHKARAQYAPTALGDIWLVQGSGLLCLVEIGSGGLSCGIDAVVARRGLNLSVFDAPRNPTRAPRHFVVFGIAPDRVSRVRVKLGALIRTVAVHHNLYVLHANRPILLLGFRP